MGITGRRGCAIKASNERSVLLHTIILCMCCGARRQQGDTFSVNSLHAAGACGVAQHGHELNLFKPWLYLS